MSELLPFIVTGLATGSLYGLAGLGLVLTYRTSGVFNFGHGAIAAGGAYLFYTLHVTHGLAWPVAAAVTVLAFAGVVGVVLERITRGLGDVPQVVVVVATVGVFLSIQGLLFILYGPVTRNFPEFLPTSGFTLLGVNLSWAQVISFTIATGGATGLYTFLRSSRLGVAMRAVVDSPTVFSLTGERPARVRAAAWAIGSGFAALSGILLAPILGLDAFLLTMLVVQAFGAAAVGSFSSLPLTYAGGLVVGVAASVATKYLIDAPFSGLPSTVPFLVLIAVLLVVPASRLPQRRASLRASLVPTARPLSGRAIWTLVVLGGGALLAVPAVVGTLLPVWISGVTYVVIFSSLALLVWASGQISLCHMAFVAVGATTMSHMAGPLPWGVALVVAGLFTVPVGALVVIPAIRVAGIYLALATLGFGILMQNVFYGTSLMFSPRLVATAPRPRLGLIHGESDRWFYYIVLAVTVATLLSMLAISRGRLGRLLGAMAETPTMLSTHGLGVNLTRLIVFCISAFFAGVGGALVITQTGAASGVGFGPIQSLLLVAVLAISGTHILRSSVLAAALFAILPGYATGFGLEEQTYAFGTLAIVAAVVIARRTELTTWFARAARNSDDRLTHGPIAARSALRRAAAQP